MLKAFLLWWGRQLRDLVPARLGLQDPSRGNFLRVVAHTKDGTPTIDLVLRNAGQELALGEFSLDPAGLEAARATLAAHAGAEKPPQAVLRLTPDNFLEREVVLPLAAEHEPENTLRYEMDRLTPFTAEEIFWAWSKQGQDRARGRLLLRLSLVPKTVVLPVIAALKRIGVAAPQLEMPHGDGPPRLIDMMPPDLALLHRRRLGLALAGGLCAVLALVAVALPFVQQARALADLDARIQALRPRLAQVETLRRRVAGDTAGADVFARERVQLGDALQVLATVTEILPDDTFLSEFTLSQGKLGIRGQSATAARLIAALAAEPTLRNPAFAAPVTRIDSGQAELFSIRAELAP